MRKEILVVIVCGLGMNVFGQQKVQEFYPSGAVQTEYIEKDGQPDGEIKMFYESGELQGVLGYDNGSQNGPSKIYYESGALQKEMTFVGGIQVDTMKIYYESGGLREVSIITNGMKEGYYASYFENGNPEVIGATKNGQAHGYCIHYKEDGSEHEKGEYDSGTRVGNWTEYDGIGIVQKKYAEVEVPTMPELIEKVEYENPYFSFEYLNSWFIEDKNKQGGGFLVIPIEALGVAKEDVQITAQSSGGQKLDQLVDEVNSGLSVRNPGFKLHSDTKGKIGKIEYRDVVYDMVANIGNSIIERKVWSRYIVDGDRAWQLSFSSAHDKYDMRYEDVKGIIDSFKLK